MRFPSKVTSFKDSIIAKLPVVLELLEQEDMTPQYLYTKVKKNKIPDIKEFLDVLDCLYALKKIELKEEVLHYVG